MLRKRKSNNLDAARALELGMSNASFTAANRRIRGDTQRRVNTYFSYASAFIFLSMWFVVSIYFVVRKEAKGLTAHLSSTVNLALDNNIQKRHHHLRRVTSTSNKLTTTTLIEEITTALINCSDGSPGIMNDDFCDCSDGSDEPMTSACSHLSLQKTFDCGDGILFIFSSRVRDGVKDCPDGSDERT